MKHVEIILKVSERCNLNCSYCYFFNKENKDFKSDPAIISIETIRNLVQFLRTIPKVSDTVFQIDLHGGEPLLLGPARLSNIVSHIAKGLADAKDVRFTVQTNAMLLNDAWIEVFAHHQITVGISVDGQKDLHDKYRVDHQGRATFERMSPKIALVKQAVSDGRIPDWGALCVVNLESDARATYQCLTRELGFSKLQFLFPDETHDSISKLQVEKFKLYMDELFDCWENDAANSVKINIFNSAFEAILSEKEVFDDISNERSNNNNMVITVSSAGNIGYDDTLRNAFSNRFNSGFNVANATFDDVNSWYSEVSSSFAQKSIPSACSACTWQKICAYATANETPLHRIKNGIVDQPSVYCDALKMAFLKSSTYLAKRGVSISRISRNFNISMDQK